ncbi:hypothetical protein QUT57_22895, partial [Xanthomonas citri pv. citri]
DVALLAFAKRNWLFLLPLMVFSGYYGVQNIIGFMHYPYEPAVTFLVSLTISVVSYIVAYEGVSERWIDRLKINIPIDYGALSVLIVIVFACIAIAACLTADHVPLFSALGGVSGPELAMYRNEFLRGRHG